MTIFWVVTGFSEHFTVRAAKYQSDNKLSTAILAQNDDLEASGPYLQLAILLVVMGSSEYFIVRAQNCRSNEKYNKTTVAENNNL